MSKNCLKFIVFSGMTMFLGMQFGCSNTKSENSGKDSQSFQDTLSQVDSFNREYPERIDRNPDSLKSDSLVIAEDFINKIPSSALLNDWDNTIAFLKQQGYTETIRKSELGAEFSKDDAVIYTLAPFAGYYCEVEVCKGGDGGYLKISIDGAPNSLAEIKNMAAAQKSHMQEKDKEKERIEIEENSVIWEFFR